MYELVPPPPTEDERVEAWRLEQAIELGCSVPLAEQVAASTIELRRFEKLIRAGATPLLAYRIEKPL